MSDRDYSKSGGCSCSVTTAVMEIGKITGQGDVERSFLGKIRFGEE